MPTKTETQRHAQVNARVESVLIIIGYIYASRAAVMVNKLQ